MNDSFYLPGDLFVHADSLKKEFCGRHFTDESALAIVYDVFRQYFIIAVVDQDVFFTEDYSYKIYRSRRDVFGAWVTNHAVRLNR